MQRSITFITPTNNREILQRNFLASPCFRGMHSHQIIIQEGYASAGRAYNDAIDTSQNDLMVFLHSDIILPEQWLSDLERALQWLEKEDPAWGVIGTYGETLDDHGRGYIYSSGLGIMGKPFDEPAQIQTLDEIVLIFRKSSGLRFDSGLPNFHMYGTDICMAAQDAGRRNYAISAFCVHNTQPSLVLGEDFYECYWHVQQKWKKYLPIQTTCVRITRSNTAMYRRKIGETYLRYLRPRKEFGGNRRSDVPRLMADVEVLLAQKGVETPRSLGRLCEVNA